MIEEPVATSVYQEAGITVPTIVPKRWGEERVFINGEGTSTRHQTGYCMKEIYLSCGGYQTSMHFHLHKHETLYVLEGALYLDWNDGKGESGTTIVVAGQAFVIPPGFQHRLRAVHTPVKLLEASTIDDPNDSIRVSL